ncbi:hypothetical protein DSO57_1037339 [Entomophthora muscae]|uniref:Uncharacterized protein n=1 Tax=Entomophthora muscae TaxID=34485 RepID=A0ACC2SCJ3_9FUNG|nr:hypothetical protein DSO57_1037339 [Entomophthora muscae]
MILKLSCLVMIAFAVSNVENYVNSAGDVYKYLPPIETAAIGDSPPSELDSYYTS